MGRTSVLLTGNQIATVIAHIAATGSPLIREKRENDIYLVEAIPSADGSFELKDGHLHRLPIEYADWEAFARQCDEDLWRIVDILTRRGYPWDLPSPDEAPSEWPTMDPLEVLEYLGSRVRPSVVDRLRDIVPTTIRVDKRGSNSSTRLKSAKRFLGWRDPGHRRAITATIRRSRRWTSLYSWLPQPSRSRCCRSCSIRLKLA